MLRKMLLQLPFLGNKFCSKGGSPGLVVMGGGSCYEGRVFESQHSNWMDIFSNVFVVKIVMIFD